MTLDAGRARLLAAAAGVEGPLELLRLAEGATFRAPGDGIVKVQLVARRCVDEVAREVRAVRALVLVGAPLAAPLGDPVAVEDAVVQRWTDVPDDGLRDARAFHALGEALAALHAAGRGLLAVGGLDLPAWEPLGWLDARLARAGAALGPAATATLRDGAAAAAAGVADGAATALHTDAHAGNARITRAGAVLVDSEGLACGPWAYDLAAAEVLERRYGGDPRRFAALCAGYGVDPDEPALAAASRLREHLAVGWLAARAADEPALAAEAARRADDLAAGRVDAVWTAR